MVKQYTRAMQNNIVKMKNKIQHAFEVNFYIILSTERVYALSVEILNIEMCGT